MLNITRKIGEKIIVGDNVVIEVIEVSGASVRLGIDAPRSVPVFREEIWASVRDENAAAAAGDATLPPTPARSAPAPTGAVGKRSAKRPASTSTSQ